MSNDCSRRAPGRSGAAFDPTERRRLLERVLSLGRHHPGGGRLDNIMSPMPAPLNLGEPCSAFELSDERHSDHFVFVSEIGGCECLADYLAQPFPTNARRVVVVDQQCVINGPLTIPQGVTLRGCGMHGPGRLLVNGAFEGATINMGTDQAGSFEAPSSIEDLDIAGTNVPGAAINIYGHNKSVRRVRIGGFNTPIRSHPNTRNVILDGLVIVGLAFSPVGVRMRGRGWRVRHCFIRGTEQWGIDCEASDVVIEACRLESNGNPVNILMNARGAVRAEGTDIRIIANYIENNGLRRDPVLDEENNPVLDDNGNPVYELIALGTAVCVTTDARRVSIIANILSGDVIAFDTRVVANPGVPNATELFGPQSAALPELAPLLLEGRHSFAFNTDSDSGTNFYPHRGLATAAVEALDVVEF